MIGIRNVPVAQIDPHPRNPRRDVGDVADLVRSIKAKGIRQNLTVVPYCPDTSHTDADDQATLTPYTGAAGNGYVCTLHKRTARYRVVIGHRRFAAAKVAGLDTVPAHVDSDLTLAEQIELMVLENVQRMDLTPVEEAEGYQQLLDLGMPDTKIARATGRALKTVRARLALFTLPEIARERIHAGQASLLDATELEKLADDPELQPLIDALTARGLTRVEKAPSSGDYVGGVSSVEGVANLTATKGAVFELSNYSTTAWIYGPAPSAAERKQRDAAVAAAEAERDAQRKAADQARTERATAWKVRDQFVRDLAKPGVHPTPKRREVILAAAGPQFLVGHISEDHDPRARGRRLASSYALGRWLYPEKTNYYPTTDQALRDLAKKPWCDLDPLMLLLIGLHLSAGQQLDWDTPAVQTIYRVLDAFGYEQSDIERARLAPEEPQS